MTPRARRIVQRRQQRSAEVTERYWQEVLKENEQSRRAAPQPRPQVEGDDYEARYRRATRPL